MAVITGRGLIGGTCIAVGAFLLGAWYEHRRLIAELKALGAQRRS